MLRCAASARALAALSALVALPVAAARAQQSAPGVSRGPRLTAAVVGTRPYLGGAAGRAWEEVGDFERAVGLSVGVGYDFGRVGASLEIDGSNPEVGGRRANALAVAALVRWTPHGRVLRGWRPQVAGGYVRYGLGGAPVYEGEVPPGLFRAGDPGPTANPDLTLLGNGARVALGAERAVWRRLSARVDVAADVLRFGTATYDGYDWSLREPGWAVAPRLATGVRWTAF